MNRLVVEKSRKQKLQQHVRDLADAALRRKIRSVEPIDAAHARVGGDQLIRKFLQRFQIAGFFGAGSLFTSSFFASAGFSAFSSSLGALSKTLISAGGSNIASVTLSNSTDCTTIVCESPAPAIFCVTREGSIRSPNFLCSSLTLVAVMVPSWLSCEPTNPFCSPVLTL